MSRANRHSGSSGWAEGAQHVATNASKSDCSRPPCWTSFASSGSRPVTSMRKTMKCPLAPKPTKGAHSLCPGMGGRRTCVTEAHQRSRFRALTVLTITASFTLSAMAASNAALSAITEPIKPPSREPTRPKRDRPCSFATAAAFRPRSSPSNATFTKNSRGCGAGQKRSCTEGPRLFPGVLHGDAALLKPPLTTLECMEDAPPALLGLAPHR
mmetsp:Transcript_41519/g.117586  ORF Transcript_41519/g.117586 Transcript_41519/m.117586 type:complete len:212 (-) Transcript_41519:68-703(-)